MTGQFASSQFANTQYSTQAGIAQDTSGGPADKQWDDYLRWLKRKKKKIRTVKKPLPPSTIEEIAQVVTSAVVRERPVATTPIPASSPETPIDKIEAAVREAVHTHYEQLWKRALAEHQETMRQREIERKAAMLRQAEEDDDDDFFLMAA